MGRDRTHSTAIRRIACSTARFSLPARLLVGEISISRREYTCIQIETEDGCVGKAYAITYGLPVAEVVERVLAPALVGQPADQTGARWEDCARCVRAGGRTGLSLKAIGLVDIALWDIKAQYAGMPLWKLLGGTRKEIPAMLVAGYFAEGQTVSDVAGSIVHLVREGISYVKLARPPSPSLAQQLFEALGSQLPASTRVVVDALWGWCTVWEAQREIAAWQIAESLGDRLAWIEDPFLPEDSELYRVFGKTSAIPLGVGDELGDRNAFRHLISRSRAQIVRVDPLAIGGVTGALEIFYLARAFGRDVSPHIYPEVNVHLALALGGTVAVETFDPRGNDLELSHQFVIGGPTLQEGSLRPAREAGLGFDLDWEYLRAHVVE